MKTGTVHLVAGRGLGTVPLPDALQILIDGYNLIHAIRALADQTGAPFDPEAERRSLLSLLHTFRHRTGARIHVVFDGSKSGYKYGYTRNDGGIDVTFSSPDESADHVLMTWLEESHHPKSILLVTGDRQIVKVARRRKAPVSGSYEFAQEVDRILSRKRKPEPPEKYRGVSKTEADQWMKLMGFDDDE